MTLSKLSRPMLHRPLASSASAVPLDQRRDAFTLPFAFPGPAPVPRTRTFPRPLPSSYQKLLDGIPAFVEKRDTQMDKRKETSIPVLFHFSTLLFLVASFAGFGNTGVMKRVRNQSQNAKKAVSGGQGQAG